MNTLRGRHQTVRKAHAPREFGGDAIVSVAGDETAQTAHSVADCGGGSGEVEHPDCANLGRASLPQQGEYAKDKAAKPGKAFALEDMLAGSVGDMPKFRPDDPNDGDDRDDTDGVGIQSPANEVAVQHPTGADCREPQKKSEGTDGKMTTEMNEWIHASRR